MLDKQKVLTILFILYLIIIVVFMLLRNLSITPDRIFIILLFAAVILGRTKSFLRDWVPFIALLLAYEMLRGFVDTNDFRVHVGDLLNLEKTLFFGFVPTVVLQSWFFHPGHIVWYDTVATSIDFLHFPLPLAVGFYFWLKNKKAYWRFVIALLTLSFTAFITFLLFPTAPPWYASQKEHLLSVYKIIDIVVAQVGWHWDLSYYYNHLNPNPVAAMPSLHSAFPWLSFLALRNYNKKIGWFFLPYPFLVWFSVVYLGEHYVIDVLGGIIYATVAYFLVYKARVFGGVYSRFLSSVPGQSVKKALIFTKVIDSK